MRVLVTGATGFIGQNATNRLVDEGHEVFCLIRDRKKANVLPQDVHIIEKDLTKVTLDDFPDNIDVVFHLAAQLGHYTISAETYQRVNSDSTRKLIEIADKKSVKQFVFCSAGFVVGYGKNMTEDMPYDVSKGYAETKALAEKFVINHRSSGINYTIIRPGYIYGPGDERRVALYKSIRKGTFILTTSGKAEFSPTYISDFLDGMMLVCMNEKAYGKIYNVCAENSSIKDYFETVAKIEGVLLKKIPIGYIPTKVIATCLDGLSMKLRNKPGIITPSRADFIGRDHSLSCKKICSELGYAPKVSLECGIKQSIDWAIANKLM